MEEQYKLDFGKHRGRTVTQAAIKDPGYIIWAVREIPNFWKNVTPGDWKAIIEYQSKIGFVKIVASVVKRNPANPQSPIGQAVLEQVFKEFELVKATKEYVSRESDYSPDDYEEPDYFDQDGGWDDIGNQF